MSCTCFHLLNITDEKHTLQGIYNFEQQLHDHAEYNNIHAANIGADGHPSAAWSRIQINNYKMQKQQEQLQEQQRQQLLDLQTTLQIDENITETLLLDDRAISDILKPDTVSTCSQCGGHGSCSGPPPGTTGLANTCTCAALYAAPTCETIREIQRPDPMAHFVGK